MKKAGMNLLLAVTAAMTIFLFGFLTGRNSNHYGITISDIPAQTISESADTQMDINNASIYELDTLPGIGPVLAQRIIDYRENNGPFTELEQLINIKGISASRLEEIAPFLTVGGNT